MVQLLEYGPASPLSNLTVRQLLVVVGVTVTPVQLVFCLRTVRYPP